MSKGKYNLIVTAHPDDETLFFGSLIQSLRSKPWKIICVTDGNGDGQGAQRKNHFENACQILKVRNFEILGFPDIYEKRLDLEKLISYLKKLPAPSQIFTHGVLGEYGHPHHQDVSFAVHQAFADHKKLFSVAWNCFPDLVIKSTPSQYSKKANILSQVYFSETQRFFNMLPGTAIESFAKVKSEEVRRIYRFLREGRPLSPKDLKRYGWLWPYLKGTRINIAPRPF